jgi:hypothetical protein
MATVDLRQSDLCEVGLAPRLSVEAQKFAPEEPRVSTSGLGFVRSLTFAALFSTLTSAVADINTIPLRLRQCIVTIGEAITWRAGSRQAPGDSQLGSGLQLLFKFAGLVKGSLFSKLIKHSTETFPPVRCSHKCTKQRIECPRLGGESRWEWGSATH